LTAVVLSVVLTTYNEERNPFFSPILERLGSFREVETIIVDGGSSDQTRDLASNFGFQVFQISNSSRAERLNLGIEKSSGNMVLLHHPRSILDVGCLNDLIERPELFWGGFRHRFDVAHPVLDFTSWYSNEIRFTRRGIVYLDHCVFARKKILEAVGGVPELTIFEDTELSKRLLARFGHPVMIPYHSTTSAVRFVKNGIWRQSLMNQVLKLGYHLGFDTNRMNAWYEKKLHLNQK
jgi:hypothetical protein